MINPLLIPELREMLAENNEAELREFCTAIHPVHAAEFMEGLTNDEVWRVLQHADLKLREEIFGFFDHDRQVAIIESQDRSEVAELIADLPADDRVDLLHGVSEDVVEEILPLLPVHERREFLRLRDFAPESAGAMMTTEIALLDESLNVRAALDELSRQAEHLETIYYIYVVDPGMHLKGVVSTRMLVSKIGKPELKIGDLMKRDLITVAATEDREEVAHRVAKYDLLAIPVVDEHRRIIGIITHDDVLDVLREEAVEDVQQLAAVDPLDESYLKTDIWTLTWKRGVWLAVLCVAAVFTVSAIHFFEKQLSVWKWLIMFIPMVMSCGGNSGNQSATLVITALHSGELMTSDWRRVIWRELRVGLLLGGVLAVLGLLIAFFMTWSDTEAHQQRYWPIVIPATLLLVVTCGAISGSMLPILFRRLGLDPALMSNPFVAGVSDVLGIVIYMTVAMLLLSRV